MKYLLDSHALLWWESDASQLSSVAYGLLSDRQNTILLSVASIWEMQIKLQTGKLKLTLSLETLVENQVTENQMVLLPVLLSHVFELGELPMHHRDPFDRLLIAQARVEHAILISRDPQIAQYDVKVVW